MTTRRQLIGGSVSAVGAATFGTATHATPLEQQIETFDPFFAPAKHYKTIQNYIWNRDKTTRLVETLWGQYNRTGESKYADWCFIYWYNYWRLAPLGTQRVKVAQLGRKMAEKVISNSSLTAWNLFWKASFIGLESISRGVLEAAQLLPSFANLMQESATLDPTEYYSNAYLGLAKLYFKAPSFPVSIGDTDKGFHYLNLAEKAQRGKFALWYLFAAEGHLIAGTRKKAISLLGEINEVRPVDVASQIILDTTRVDAKSLLTEIENDSYQKYKWDPMFTPLEL